MKNRAFLTIFCLAVGLALSAAPASAQATRTWVSGVGDDANPCSRTAPCKTFAGAISKTAVAGEIDALDPGGFGAVTITKAITIDGGPGIAGVLVSGTNAIIVNAPAGAVVNLRNLDIDGVGTGLNGVSFLAGGALHVDNSHIYGFTAVGISMTPSAAAHSVLVVNNSVITDNAGGGIVAAPTGAATVSVDLLGLTASRNKFGLKVADGAVASVRNSLFSSNTNNGVIAASTAAACEINIEKSTSSNNGAFGVLTSGANATIRISEVGIFDNLTGIGALGGAVISYGNNQIAGNGTNGAPTSTIASQ